MTHTNPHPPKINVYKNVFGDKVSLYIVLGALGLTMQTRLVWNSQILLPLPSENWNKRYVYHHARVK